MSSLLMIPTTWRRPKAKRNGKRWRTGGVNYRPPDSTIQQVGLGLAVVNLSAALVMAFAIIRVWRWRGHNGASWLICLGAGLILLNAWFVFQDLLAH